MLILQKKFQLFNKFRLSISNSFANDTDDEQEGKTPRHRSFQGNTKSTMWIFSERGHKSYGGVP